MLFPEFKLRDHTTLSSLRKSLGQHFLVDQGALNRVVGAADLKPEDTVVEVGPGSGLLTKLMVKKVSKVYALEIDKGLVSHLRNTMADASNLVVMEGDARTVDLGLFPESYKMVANLPYYAAVPILRKFLEASSPPDLIVVTVQKEVAESITASPGRMRLLSVAVQVFGSPSIAGYIHPKSFNPVPKVTSAIVRIEPYERGDRPVLGDEGFFKVVRGGFSAPRKQLRNSLAQGLGLTGDLAESILREGGIEPSLRAEALQLQDWGKIREICGRYNLC